MIVSADMNVSEILRKKTDADQILKEFGMHCFGCAIASEETLEEAAKAHDVEIEKLLEALNS